MENEVTLSFPSNRMDLPFELVSWIFSFLALRDFARCRMVCSSWALAYRRLPAAVWEKIVAEYPGGRKPNTRRARKWRISTWLNKTMNTFSQFMKKKQYEEAMRWAA